MVCKYIFTTLHVKLTPKFEAFLFLKIHPDYWDIQIKQLAYADALSTNQKKRMAEAIQQDEMYLEIKV